MPVVELNLDDDQMEDRIDDALEFFQEYHFDATEPTFLKHQITASTLKLTANVVFTAVVSVFTLVPVFPEKARPAV